MALEFLGKKELSLATNVSLDKKCGRDFATNFAISIYERILFASISSLSLDDAQESIVISAAADRYVDSNYRGFVGFLAGAMVKKSSGFFYKVEMSTGEIAFSENLRTSDVNKIAEQVNYDFSRFNQADQIIQVCEMLVDCIEFLKTGLATAKTIFLKLQGLNEMIDDKKTRVAVEQQIKSFENAARSGTVAYMSEGGQAEFLGFDVAPAESALNLCYKIFSSITGYPAEFFSGIGGSTLSDTGASTERANYRANKFYAQLVIIPFLKTNLGIDAGVKVPLIDSAELMNIVTLCETSEILSEDDKNMLLTSVGLSGINQ